MSLLATILVAGGCDRGGAERPQAAPSAGLQDLAETAFGVHVLPVSLTPPRPGSVVGHAEVVIENTTSEAIPRHRIGAAEPLEVIRERDGPSPVVVLRAAPTPRTMRARCRLAVATRTA